jgi:hypothetical protein
LNHHRKLKEFIKNGCLSLLSGHYGNANRRKVKPAVELFLNSLFAKSGQKPTRAEIERQYSAFLTGQIEVINNETGEVYNPAKFPDISISTINLYLNKWKNAIANESLRSGNRQKWLAKFKPYHSMKVEMAGSIIFVDDLNWRNLVNNYAKSSNKYLLIKKKYYFAS